MATHGSTSIRGKLNDQLSALQGKHNAEVELLEDLKLFTRQRSALEKQYAESLHRLVIQYNGKRELQPPPSLPDFEKHENRGLIEVWKALLEKTDELSKRRQTISELLLTQVSDVAKQQKRLKESNFKRLFEISQKMNSELLESTKELLSNKKVYCEMERVCEEARSKYNEAETRLRKRDLKFFESMSSLEKSHSKASERLKMCQKRTTANRNEYLLSIETTNTHLKQHALKDLQQIMQGMDGELYNKVREAYSTYAQLEVDAAQFVKAEFEDLMEQAFLVNREYVVECFLHINPVLREMQEVIFEPYGEDSVTAISRDHGVEIFLDKDARKWANNLTKDQMAITSLQKQVKGLQSVTSAYTKNPEFGTLDAQTEALQKTDALLEEIRQLEVQTRKAETRLNCLREAGIDVNKWLQKAESSHRSQNNKTSTNELTPNLSHGRVSQLSMPSLVGGSQDFDVETSSVNSALLGPDDTTSLESGKSENLPKHCVVLYTYTAQRADELDIVEEEELEVLEWDDGDGWCKGRNKSGREGYFPQSYVKSISRPTSPSAASDVTTPSHTAATTQQRLSITSDLSTVNTTPRSSLAFNTPSNMPSLTFDLSALSITSDLATPTQAVPSPGKSGGPLLKAVYEYNAQFKEELSFPEGAIIQLLRTDKENGVEDGWWEGSYQGKTGVFPSLVVERIDENADLNSTLTVESYYRPPSESPPPLPDFPPPPISPVTGNSNSNSNSGGVGSNIGNIGPSATIIPDYINQDDLFSTPVGGGGNSNRNVYQNVDSKTAATPTTITATSTTATSSSSSSSSKRWRQGSTAWNDSFDSDDGSLV